MALSFFFPNITIFSVIIYQLRIFNGLSIILWTKSMKKKGIRSLNINFLFIMGIILTIFSGLYMWFPGIRLFNFPTEAERLLFYSIAIFYQILFPIQYILIGVFLFQFLREKFYQNDKKVIIGPIVFILSYILFIIVNISFEYVFIFEYSLYLLTYIPFMIGIIIIVINIIIGTVFLLLYFLQINNEYLLLFGIIILGLIIVDLITYINYLSLFIGG